MRSAPPSPGATLRVPLLDIGPVPKAHAARDGTGRCEHRGRERGIGVDPRIHGRAGTPEPFRDVDGGYKVVNVDQSSQCLVSTSPTAVGRGTPMRPRPHLRAGNGPSLGAMSDVGVLADEYWDYYRGTAQLWNIDRGDVDQIEHWEDLSPDGVAERIETLTAFALRAESLGASTRGERERIMSGAMAFSARSEVARLPFVRDLSLVAGPFSLVTFLSTLVPAYALVTRHHGAGYVEKLRALPSFVDGWVAGLRDG